MNVKIGLPKEEFVSYGDDPILHIVYEIEKNSLAMIRIMEHRGRKKESIIYLNMPFPIDKLLYENLTGRILTFWQLFYSAFNHEVLHDVIACLEGFETSLMFDKIWGPESRENGVWISKKRITA